MNIETRKKKKKAGIIVTGTILCIVAVAAAVYFFFLRDTYRQIKVESFEGDVELYRAQKDRDMEVYEGQQLVNEDRLTIGEDSLLVLQVDYDKYIAAEADTSFEIEASGTEEEGRIRIRMLYGEALFTIENKLNDDSFFEVTTPKAVMGVRGTVFRVNYDDEQETVRLDVEEGTVHAEHDNGETMDVNAGESVIITEDGIVPVISIANAGIGDIVTFGSYEQDNDSSNGAEPVEWIVLDKENGKALLLSLKILDDHIYDASDGEIMTWERCGLRKWLNDAFYQTAFSTEEQGTIAESELKNPDNPWGIGALTESCPDTSDKVFVLSFEEVKEQYAAVFSPLAEVTPYAQEKGVYVWEDHGRWWLRTPGTYGYQASYVAEENLNSSWQEEKNYINDFGALLNNEQIGVRPAVRVTY